MNRLKPITKISYALGDFGCCIINNIISMYYMFFCTVFLDIPLAAVGIIMLAVQIWDAVNDIIIGYLIDYKDGVCRPWIKFFMLPCCISALMIFQCPLFTEQSYKIMWVSLFYFLYVFFYSCVNLPYSAMISTMTYSKSERSALSSYRYVGAYAGSLVVASCVLPAIKILGGSSRLIGYRITVSIFCVAALVAFMFLYINCRENICPTKKEAGKSVLKTAAANADAPRIFYYIKNCADSLKNLFTHKSVLIIFIVNFFYWLKYPFYSEVMPYFYRFYIGIDETNSSIAYTLGTVAGIIVLPLCPYFVKKFGSEKTLATSCAVSIVSMMAGFLSHRNIILITVCFAVNYAAEAYPLSVLFCMLSESLDHAKSSSDAAVHGIGFSVFNFISKIGPAIGSLIISFILNASALNTDVPIGYTHSAAALLSIRIVFWIVPCIVSAIMIIILYSLKNHLLHNIPRPDEKPHDSPETSA